VSAPATGGPTTGGPASGLAAKKCMPCEGGTAPLTEAQASALRAELHPDWKLGAGARSLERALKFRDFYRTMSFVNALAHIANVEDHHPDLEVGYNYCNVKFSTHSIGGLSENDFICAAKLDRL
jgi:4a-hydroxytetrahydrobiopterin dehydratase